MPSIFIDAASGFSTSGSSITPAFPVLFQDGAVSAPSIAFTNDSANGFYRSGSNDWRLVDNAADLVRFTAGGFTLSSSVALGWGSSGVSSADTFVARDAANTLALKNAANAQKLVLYQTTTGPVANTLNMTAPTISSGFGGSPSIVAGSTAFCFRVNVGSGGVATSGVVAMPTATTGWQAIVQDMTNNTATRVTATTTTTITLTAAAAWAANDILVVYAVAF